MTRAADRRHFSAVALRNGRRGLDRAAVRGTMLQLCLVLLLALPADVLARCDIRPALRAIPPAGAGELSLVTQNLWRLADTRSDAGADQPVPEAYLSERLDDIAEHIREVLGAPHLLALQEVENLSLLKRLADRISARGGPRYQAFLIDGLDPSGIDVALLARDPVKIGAVTDLFRAQRFNGHALFSRPPLRVEVEAPVAMELVVVHLRSGRHLHDGKRGAFVREKRRRQASVLGEWLASRTEAGVPAAIVGDLNSAPGDDLYAEPHALLLAGPAAEVWGFLPESERFSYIYRCQPQAIDNILFNPHLLERVARGAVSRGNAGHQHRLYQETAERLVSDHDAVAVFFEVAGPEAGSDSP